VKCFIRYTNGDVYEGNFKDGVAHGHGLQKQGHFMASVASVYIGEWVNGVKQGYGVMDDIATGMLLLNESCVDFMHPYMSSAINIFYNSIKKLLSFHLLSKMLKIRKLIILSFILYECET
jgi:hypothetical protein